MKRAKILVIEPSEMLLQGLQAMLRQSNTLDMVGHCSCIAQALPLLTRYKADIVLVNPTCFNQQDIIGIRSYFQEFPSLLLAALRYAYFPQNIINQFDCCIDIDDSINNIEFKINQACQNRNTIQSGDAANSELTKKEKEVLALIVKGKMNKEIAEELHLSIHTIISHRKNNSKKTDIKSISGLTIYALLHNIIQKEDIL